MANDGLFFAFTIFPPILIIPFWEEQCNARSDTRQSLVFHILICTTITGWLAAAFAWIKWLYEIREKRKEKEEKEKEKTAKEKAESELREIKRRGDAPYIEVCNTAFQHLYHSRSAGEVRIWRCDNGNVLSYWRDEVGKDMPAGHPVIFVVANIGQPARSVNFKLDGKEIAIKQEIDFDDAQGLQFLEYPYDPATHGQEQKLTVAFETAKGNHDTHTYLLKHGFRVLRRIDPALPA